jgi:hypothetical protein
MPAKLTIIINRIKTVPNSTNAEIIDRFYHYIEKQGPEKLTIDFNNFP